MEDNFGRKIKYARISVTDLCNLRCAYCMPEGVEKKKHGDILSIEELCAVSDALSELGVEKQRITGGEPLVRRGVEELFCHIGKNPLMSRLAVTTNGIMLPQRAEILKAAGVAAVNISIDTLDDNKYSALTKLGSLKDALSGISAAVSAGFQTVKLNAVLLRGINDGEIKTLADFAKDLGIKIRFIELMPFESQLDFAKRYFISTKEIAERYGLRFESEKVQNSKEEAYVFPDGTEVYFISPISHRFCSECDRVRITADGKLINCLHESREYPLREYIGDKERLKTYIAETVKLKPERHKIGEGSFQIRGMENIGG